jgi:hypothetical protein
VDRDALPELAQFRLGQLGLEFGLTHEEDLEQLLAVHLEVREQADLFEQIALEILRLVQKQDRQLAAPADLDQMPLEQHHHLRLGDR